ncbi:MULTISPECIES: molybdopterin-synthase adenylyltransferase MoeB [unclassified Thioalkalivibrio]|uniref:HesA/MoeB/ThiF family protein n=1 Tax=unclassified Thioalkalivibrio TaxID=2621013 RepID=UPI00036C17A5|nr:MULTISPECIES: molybdopterin-synthase adenylyltransferase MoeB [unclassified Thioalkalivibrio]
MDDPELLRYSRQIMLPGVGVEGQQGLQEAHAVIMGLGGLGSPVAAYLAAAGVGRLTLVDPDHVEVTNLQRQILHTDADIGRDKVESAARRLAAMNPNCRVETRAERLDVPAMSTLFAKADVVLDGTDNFASRGAINRAAVASGTPLVSGAVIRFEGQLTTFDYRDPGAACYHCLYGEGGGDEDTCAANGVLASLPGVIGSLQATEALKLLIGLPTLSGRLLIVDATSMQFREIRLRRDPDCPVCAQRPARA